MSDKQKLLKDSEVASKLASQPQLKPQNLASSASTSKTFSQTKDLTATLMEKNVNQMKNSQTFSNFNMQPSQSSSWRPQQQPIMQQQFIQQPIMQQQQQQRPDLSAFDSLLTLNTNSNKTPMNSMMNSHNFGSNWMPQQPQQHQMQQQWQRPQQPTVVKSLTENDISDLLS